MDYQPKPLGDKSLHFNVGRLAFFMDYVRWLLMKNVKNIR